MNREAWLTEVASRIVPLFVGVDVKPFRVTCGWPSVKGLGTRGRRVGECWYGRASSDGTHEIFISPVIDRPAEAAGVIAHELVHVVAGSEAGHGRDFVRFARHVGLDARKPAQAMPGRHLAEKLDRLVADVGPYPHRALVPTKPPKPKREPTGATLTCPACGCKVRMGLKWLADAGAPTCGCGSKMSAEPEEGD